MRRLFFVKTFFFNYDVIMRVFEDLTTSRKLADDIFYIIRLGVALAPPS